VAPQYGEKPISYNTAPPGASPTEWPLLWTYLTGTTANWNQLYSGIAGTGYKYFITQFRVESTIPLTKPNVVWSEIGSNNSITIYIKGYLTDIQYKF